MERITSTITLPVSGRIVTIREGDGYTDKILTQRNKSIFETIPEYIASLIEEMEGISGKVSKDDILNLLMPDQEALAIECYKVNYGNIFEFTNNCSSCGFLGVHSYDLDKLEKLVPDDSVDNSSDPQVEIILPRTGKKAVLGLLNGHKEAILTTQLMEGVFDPNQATYLAMRTIDGSDKFSYEDIINLPLQDHKAIRAARRKLNFGLNTNISTRCTNCGERTLVSILMHKDFLFPAG